MSRGFRKPLENSEPQKAHYAINLSRLKADDTYISELSERIENAIQNNMSVNSIIAPLVATGAAFGPFDDQRGAGLMAASNLDDNNKDYFGIHWGFIETKMTESEFQRPLIEDATIYICSNYAECKGKQRFKGSCSKCKTEGKPLVPTIKIRDWEGQLE
tara:strand:- start:368 stop:844 length:477 start_codon:yes stop_codon:yes gene_type:complete